MAKIDDTEYIVQQARELGRRNRDLLPAVRNWCSVMDIKNMSRGTLYEITGDPTQFQISCVNGQGGMLAPSLERVAGDFIETNCLNCAYHKEISAPNFGRTIQEGVRKRLEEASHREQAEIAARRALKEKIDSFIAASKAKAQPPGISILTLISELETSKQPEQAAELILEASSLTPTFFIPAALDAMAIYYKVAPWGSKLLSATANVISSGSPLSAFGKDQCTDLFAHRLHLEELALLALSASDFASFDAWQLWIDQFIDSLNYLRMFGYAEPENISKDQRENYLGRWLAADPDNMMELLAPRLLSPDKMVRINTARLLTKMHYNFPDRGFRLLPTLMKGLALPDAPVLESSDDAIRRLVSSIILATGKEGIDEFLALLDKQPFQEAYMAAWTVLNLLLTNETFVAANQELVNELATELSSHVTNKDFPWEMRDEMLETLSALAGTKKASEGFFTTVLGCLSTVNEEKKTFLWYREQLGDDQKPATFNQLLNKNILDIDHDENRIDHCKDELISILADELRRTPDRCFPIFMGVLTPLDSQQAGGYKTDLTVVALKGLTEPKYVALYIPHLYTFLFDPYEKNVRVQSMYFLRNLIEDFPELVTDPLMGLVDAFHNDPEIRIRAEVVTIVSRIAESEKFTLTKEHIDYVLAGLKDKYIMVISRSVMAVRQVLRHLSPKQIGAVVGDLGNWTPPEIAERHRDIQKSAVWALLDIAALYPRFLPTVVKNAIRPLCSLANQYVADDYIEMLGDVQAEHPEFRIDWLEAVLGYIATTRREPTSSAFDQRIRFFDTLFAAPYRDLLTLKDRLLKAAADIVKIDPIDACHFIYLFGEMEWFDEIQAICRQIQEQVANAKANQGLLTGVRIFRLTTEIFGNPSLIKEQIQEKITEIKNELSTTRT
jgi:hypothetical protein